MKLGRSLAYINKPINEKFLFFLMIMFFFILLVYYFDFDVFELLASIFKILITIRI